MSKTPTSSKKPEARDSGKKLVQARLPFKIITTSPAPVPTSSPRTADQSDKKPKLSTNDEAKNVQAQNALVAAENPSDVIVIPDEGSFEENIVPKSAPFKICLPFSGKNPKRRKSHVTDDNYDDDNLEVRDESDLQLNPLKRPKIDGATANATENIDEECNTELESCSEENANSTAVDLNESPVLVTAIACFSTSTSDESTRNNEKIVKEIDEKVVKTPATGKKLKLMEQRHQAREEKERKLMAERQLKQQEKQKREEAKQLERQQREEEKRKQREDRDEKKRLEREEKERKRQAEYAAKNEERRQRIEAKEEEERKRKDKEVNLRNKAAKAFTKFFVPKSNKEIDDKMSDEELNINDINKAKLAFRPFQVKGAMKLAPVCRRRMTDDQRKQFDGMLKVANETNLLYLNELRSGLINPVKWTKRTWSEPKDTNGDSSEEDIVIVEDELSRAGQEIIEDKRIHMKYMRVKYYKFHENRRPPYYGTWRKYSKIITPRRPFAQDVLTFDYDVDSDLEWEEEEPGELLEDSDNDEKDKELENDDYDVDNEWMVPHGHLSDEEMRHEDEFGNVCVESDNDNNTREAQKAKLKVLQQEFAIEMKKKTHKIQPRLVGCIWVEENGKQPANCSNLIWQTIKVRAMLFKQPPILTDDKQLDDNATKNHNDSIAKPVTLSDKMLKDLVRLVHGNSHSKQFLIKEFIAHVEANDDTVSSGEFRVPLKSTVRKRIDKIAQWQIIDQHNKDNQNDGKDNVESSAKSKKIKKRLCWVVRDSVLNEMGITNQNLQNKWCYLLSPRKSPKVNVKQADVMANINSSQTNTTTPALTEVVVNKTFDEIRDITLNRHNAATAVTISPSTGKKRVPLLMSVARGQQIPTMAKNALISQFLEKKDKDGEMVEDGGNENKEKKTAADEIVILD